VLARDMGELVKNPNFHSINVHDMDGAEKLLHAIVRLNRKTGEDTLQGSLGAPCVAVCAALVMYGFDVFHRSDTSSGSLGCG